MSGFLLSGFYCRPVWLGLLSEFMALENDLCADGIAMFALVIF